MQVSRSGIKFLKAIRKKTGRAPKVLDAVPGLNSVEATCFNAFLLLRPSTPTAIATADIIAYANAIRYRDVVMFIRLIKAMDNTYMSIMAKKGDKPAPDPAKANPGQV